MFYVIKVGEPTRIIVISFLFRVCWGYRIRRFLFRRYLKSATHVANFMFLLHDETVQGWAYPEAVRRWAYDTIEDIVKSPERWNHVAFTERPEHYLSARNDFRIPALI